MKYRCTGWLATLVCVAGVWAASPATTPAGLEDRVNQIIKQFDSESYQEREAAGDAGNQLPAEALPLLQAAAQKTGLSPEVNARLTGVIKTLQRAAGKQSKHEIYLDFYRKHLSEEYERVGKKDPKWDVAARAFLEAFAIKCADEAVGRDNDDDLTAFQDAVITSQCQDPFVRFNCSRSARNGPSSNSLAEVSEGLIGGGYSEYNKMALLQCSAMNYPLLAIGTPAVAHGFYTRAIERWPAILKAEPDIPTDLALSWLIPMVEDRNPGGVPREKIYEMLDAALAKAIPEDSLIRLNVRGAFLIKYAWDARGGGWASTVTPEGWKLFGERLAEAEKVLTHCYDLYPNDPHAATKMLTVELGQGEGRQRMELWFGRAMKADPGNVEACQLKMWYLAPRWHGSIEEQLEFGRQCLASAQFESRIPLLVVDAHLASETQGPWGSEAESPYLSRPDVWPDIVAAYDGFIAKNPKAWWARSAYADLAYKAGKWKQANDLYKALDTGPSSYREKELVRFRRIEIAARQTADTPAQRASRIAADSEKDVADLKRLMLDAYDKVGKKDPTWDDAARKALLAASRAWSNDADRDFSEADTMLESAKIAVDAGCPDPLVRFIYSNAIDSYVMPRDKKFKSRSFKDSDELLKSEYPPFIKLLGATWGTNFRAFVEINRDTGFADECQALLEKAMEYFPAAAAEKSVRGEVLRKLSNELLLNAISLRCDPEASFKRVRQSFEAANADPLIVRKLEMRFNVDVSRPINSLAATVGMLQQLADSTKVRRNHLREELVTMWQENPLDSFIPQIMLTIDGPGQMRPEMREFWLRQVLVAEPANYNAAESYIRPKSPMGRDFEDATTYAERCATMGDYRSQIPFLQVKYLEMAARTYDAKPEAEKLSDDETWQKIAGVYTAYLSQFPLDSSRRSEYASFACLTGRWPIAAEQFKVLGNRVKPKAFYTQERLDACRAKIETLMGKGFLPLPPAVEQ